MSPTVTFIVPGLHVADARMSRFAQALVRTGCTVRIFGLGDSSLGPPGCATVGRPPGGRVVRMIRSMLWPWRFRSEVIVTVNPETIPSAALVRALTKTTWVSDHYEDFEAVAHDRDWVPSLVRSPLQMVVRVLNWATRFADVVVVADDHVRGGPARHRLVAKNIPDVSVFPERDRDENGYRAIYIGDLRRSRGLFDMMEAVALTHADVDPWTLDLVGPVAAEDREEVERLCQRPQYRGVRFHGRLPSAASWEIGAGAHLGLCLLHPTPAYSAAMPSKVFEYEASGIPTVATPLPRVADRLGETGAGVVAATAQEVADCMRRYATDAVFRSELQTAAQRAKQVAAERPQPYDAVAQTVARATDWTPHARGGGVARRPKSRWPS